MQRLPTSSAGYRFPTGKAPRLCPVSPRFQSLIFLVAQRYLATTGFQYRCMLLLICMERDPREIWGTSSLSARSFAVRSGLGQIGNRTFQLIQRRHPLANQIGGRQVLDAARAAHWRARESKIRRLFAETQ